MENPSQIQSLDLGTAPKKAYNTPRMEPQGKANDIVRSGTFSGLQEACDNSYNVSGPC